MWDEVCRLRERERVRVAAGDTESLGVVVEEPVKVSSLSVVESGPWDPCGNARVSLQSLVELKQAATLGEVQHW